MKYDTGEKLVIKRRYRYKESDYLEYAVPGDILTVKNYDKHGRYNVSNTSRGYDTITLPEEELDDLVLDETTYNYRCTKCGEISNLDQWNNHTIKHLNEPNIIRLEQITIGKEEDSLFYVCPKCDEYCYNSDHEIEKVI